MYNLRPSICGEQSTDTMDVGSWQVLRTRMRACAKTSGSPRPEEERYASCVDRTCPPTLLALREKPASIGVLDDAILFREEWWEKWRKTFAKSAKEMLPDWQHIPTSLFHSATQPHGLHTATSYISR